MVWTKHEGGHKSESCHLVPGDILLLEGQKLSLPCDAILIDGSCVVNEGMLTGESVPVTKTPLPHTDNTMPWKKYSVEDYRRHILFCGTEIIQTRRTGNGPARAVVLQTGFNTAKGDLVRSILYPKPFNFKLYKEAFKFIVCLALVGIVGLIYAACVYVSHKKSVSDTVVMALLLMTGTVPPAIPAALTTGIVYAQKRLKKKKIFCVSPQRINICGQINLVCFDKVRAQGCSGSSWMNGWFEGGPGKRGPMRKVLVFARIQFQVEVSHGFPSSVVYLEMEESSPEDRGAGVPETCIVVKPGPAASQNCKLESLGHKSVLQRHPLAWRHPARELSVSPSSQAPVEGMAILHQFPFSSALLRMSVITQELGKKDVYDLYMKGAPEMVASFCEPMTGLLQAKTCEDAFGPVRLHRRMHACMHQIQLFGNYQYLIQDVCISLVVCLTMSLTEANPKLAPYRPPGRLLSPPLLLSVILNVCFTLAAQVFAFLFVKQQPWYSQLRSHRKPIYTNYVFSCLLCIQLGMSLFLFFADIEAVYKGLEFLCTPNIWRIYVLIILVVTFCVSFFVEDVILQNYRLWLWIKALFRFRSSSQYRKLQRQLERDALWPPMRHSNFAADRESKAYINPIYENNNEN
ncbi:hypothetical protein JD844_007751 [Phrynosoma platyrhinos]|uniref:P-type ATPase A domain-containing protein n=1 Tax=Phrynosoma platyrhinos TaxID=52577 RepID=A0ABQ7T3B2_PHRPL|nr:hypothetical protein JD844_007751 [Phrynosoma platyrhinos]